MNIRKKGIALKKSEQQEYRLQNLSCASCAKKFEKNIQNISTVEEVQLNFGAAKLTVIGEASIEQLEEAGAFDGIKVKRADDRRVEKNTPFFKKKENILAGISLVFVLAGYLTATFKGDDYLPAIALFLLAIVIGGYDIFKTGFKNLIRLEFDMKTLMTIAIIGAAIIGEWQEGAVVVFLFAVSEALEAYSMNKARQSISSLMDIAPATAMIRRGNQLVELATEDILIGDILIVKPGQKIAMDGKVQSGISSVNQAPITGESIPVKKETGDEVFAGTLNEEGALEIVVTKHVKDTTIAKIIHLVEEAQAEKAPAQKFVDQFAKYYTPLIILIALLVAFITPLFLGDWNHWIYQGLAVLVVGCPCALVISTPVAIVTAIGNAARQGVLIKGGVYLEQLGRIKAIAFDKTGTLTKGVPEVTNVLVAEHITEETLIRLVAAVEQSSQHPLARAILQHAKEHKIQPAVAEQFQSVTGKGAYAEIEGVRISVGSLTWIQETVNVPKAMKSAIINLQKEGKSVIAAMSGETFLGSIAIADKVRSNSVSVIQKLRANGIAHTVMLTGDAEPTARAIAQELQLTDIRAGLLPEDKLQAMKELQSQYGSVAMVGDGINDAPALANATVGIAMGGAGTDTALETADVALMADDLEKLPYTIRLSRKTLRIVKENIMFALGLKLIALLLIIPGWLTLWIAIFADMGATLLVVLNSLRLMRMQK
ncbi:MULTISPECIES: heavy metal translocating P-type ATPase [unclassified Viridibacillus]|uniref:heavy metal translocating P-type ATPase n=1 Tax=unclassified Viridibacillus TaxID=2617942 RepID=UPI00096F682A|nr:heavy metal translocating P-type ATPase [Viridibacillus sp. FSL H8-0123]OMC82173.1 cadmium transporter [Viridibacillus sp. FSL H8-0123]